MLLIIVFAAMAAVSMNTKEQEKRNALKRHIPYSLFGYCSGAPLQFKSVRSEMPFSAVFA